MHQEFSFHDLFVILRKRRTVIATLVLVSVAVGVVLCIVSTRRYRAVGTLQVQKESSDIAGLSGMLGGAGMDDASDSLSANITIQTQSKILQSDTLALRVISSLNMEHTHDFENGSTLARVINWIASSTDPDNPDLPLEDSPQRRTRALKIFAKHLTVEPVGGTRLITITYSNPDPKLAAAVVNSLMQELVGYTLETRFAATNQASTWLNGQMGDLKKQAEDLQAKVVDLQQRSGVFSLGSPDATGKDQVYSSVLDRLQQATTALGVAESNRIVKEAIYEYAKNGNAELISGLGGTAVGAASPMANSLQYLQSLRMQQSTVQASIQQTRAKFGDAYPKLTELNQNKAALDMAVAAEISRLTARAQNDYLIAQKSEIEARGIYNRQKEQAGTLNNTAIAYAITKQEADQSRGLYEDLLRRLKEAGVMEGLKSTNLTVVDAGRAPARPSSPNIPVYLGISIAGGIFLGIVCSLLLNGLDNKIHSEEDLGIPGSSVFGILPWFDGEAARDPRGTKSDQGTPAPIPAIIADSRSPYAEALRGLALSITLARGDQRPKVVLVTSAVPNEGKTELSLNLSVLFAQRHMRVLLVEADMRRPRLKERSGIRSHMGLSSILSGVSDTADIQSVSHLHNVNILTCGQIPPDAAGLLNSERMKSLVEEWRREYDLVIIDSAPVLAVSDAASLFPLVDLALVVTRFDFTTKQSLRRCISNLRLISVKPIGIVLNGMVFGSSEYYEYYGHSGSAYYGEVPGR